MAGVSVSLAIKVTRVRLRAHLVTTATSVAKSVDAAME